MSRGHFYNLASAMHAARSGELEKWVHAYLRGPGQNVPFSDGLIRQERHWRGPWIVELGKLERTCGPEEEMPFVEEAASWRQRVSDLVRSYHTIEAFPPLIVEYKCGRLLVNDGSHRHAAFCSLGLRACWAIVWYPDAAQFAHHEARGLEL